MTRLFQDDGLPQLRERFGKSAHIIDAKIGEILAPLDLDVELMLVVYAIDRCDGGTIADVAKLVALDETELDRSVRALQLRGLVARPKPREAAAAVELRFTTEGRRRVLRAHNALGRFDERLGRWMGSHSGRLAEGLDRLEAFPDFSA